MYKFKIKQMTV